MSSSSKEMSKFEKEKQKLIQEKCQGLLNEMLRDDDNKYCVDCDAKGPRWASWNLGIFLCIRCAGIHRNLGVHISRVKSVNLDSWTPEQVVTMQQMGNSRARAVYEANLPDNFRRPQTDVPLENFIRAKYEHTKYIAQEFVKPPPPRVDWNAEVEEQIRRKKDKKNIEAAAAAVLPPKLGISSRQNQVKTSNNTKPIQSIPLGKIEVPKPTVQAPPAATPEQAPQQPTSASDDLLGLTTDTVSSIISDPFASPVKCTNTPSNTAATTGTSSTSDDLGGVFTAPDQNAQQKMTKESILSLYGSLGGGGTGFSGGGGSMAPPPAGNNPFAPAMGQQFGASMNNPFPTQPQGMFSADLIGNNGFGGVGGGSGLGMGGNSQMTSSNLSQLQQGLFSMNLTSTPQSTPQSQSAPHTQNSNLIFNNTIAAPPTTNLNMLMMNTATPGNLFATPPQSAGGGGTSLPSMVAPSQTPQQQFLQQQPQQNQLFNQFQQASPIGLFQNGGSGGGLGLGGLGNSATGNGSSANNHVNVDLLWK